MTEDEFINRLKVYVLVRKDILTEIQCGVQAAHAVAELVHDHEDPAVTDWVVNHRTLIFLSATEKQIAEKKELLSTFKGFKEPDLNNVETAVAFTPVTHIVGVDLFGDLKLL